ncbi:MAG TPA: hypothetical protein VFJ82_26045 [Longimicrobium sp.]|nr:hypothetical protein [Longimicrobium sp.]
MRPGSFSLTLLAAAALAACGTSDLAVTGPDHAPGAPHGVAFAPACVDFNVPPAGAIFGAPIPTPVGAVVWTENAIPVSVHRFLLTTGAWAYNWMRIEPVPASFTLGVGNTAHLNNITAGFDFTGLPFVPTKVQFDFMDLGGYENLVVNASPIYVGQLIAAPSPWGGTTVTSVSGPVPGGIQGTVTITGAAVNRVLVGGQELWLDHVCAYP